ncbi:MAG: hypothetical protein LJE59_08265 [Chromatiaceae bacterium]|nr:hypothetical protein [Chromatiaceae bacterium]
MSTLSRTPKDSRVDICSLEADMAFFEARISIAGDAPDTVYQRAQIKTYRTLGSLLGETLKTLRPPDKAAPEVHGGNHIAA